MTTHTRDAAPRCTACRDGTTVDFDFTLAFQPIVNPDVCRSLGIKLIAEGIETIEELSFLEQLGIRMFQGYLFARPGFESLPEPEWPEIPLDPALAESTLTLARA